MKNIYDILPVNWHIGFRYLSPSEQVLYEEYFLKGQGEHDTLSPGKWAERNEKEGRIVYDR